MCASMESGLLLLVNGLVWHNLHIDQSIYDRILVYDQI